MIRVLLTVCAALAVGRARAESIDWGDLVRDPAAQCRWLSDETLVIRGTAAD